MILNETIEYADKTAEMWETDAKKWLDYTPRSFGIYKGACKEEYIKCKKQAEEYRQLAEWLKDYRRLLELKPKTDMLEKIENEIKQLTSRYTISREQGGMGQVEWSDRLIKESDVLNIINKYRESVETKQGLAYTDQETLMPAT